MPDAAKDGKLDQTMAVRAFLVMMTVRSPWTRYWASDCPDSPVRPYDKSLVCS